ncbi:flavoprotein [Streptomyces sp. MST-110588]|uniref:flavoprotein n=1 Tax=Streptomyces sp. MST-110588 TaxID=2833628 RepID=UPI001F5DC023|nr:flavoprotein [Streptomyces sp. MST-110588]UNO41779.1 flavoprotein [Streptomyces sp. MST-110588]
MSETSEPAGAGFTFTPRRLLLVGTGAIGVTFLPYWVKWMSIVLPDVECRVVVTRSAERFVTREALSAINSSEALLDMWPDEPRTKALHVEWSLWAEAVAVYPATVHFISRLATGMGDTPAMLALQCTQAPIGVAPSLPPGAIDNPVLARHMKELRERPNVCVIPPQPGPSSTTGRDDAYIPPELPKLLRLMEALPARSA